MVDVLIIGAGLSGLTTAYKILQKESSLKLKILEASDTIGGQIASKPDDDLGGKWLTAEHSHIYGLLSDLGIQMRRRIPVSKNFRRIWDIDTDQFSFLAKYELRRYMNYLDLKSQLYRPGSYDLMPEDRPNTMWKHIKANLFFDSSRLFMMNFVRLMTGVEANEICFVEFMNILHSCGNCKALIQLYIEPSQSVLEFSSEQLIGALESRLEQVTIKRLTKVIEIQHHDSFVQVREINGDIHTAKVVVLAIPCNYIEDIFITPPIHVQYETSYLSDKYYITSFRAQYDEAHWRQKGLSGNLCLSNPVIYAQQYTPNSLIGFILHQQGFENFSQSIILKALAKNFGNEMTEPIQYNQKTFEQTALFNLPQTIPWNRVIWSSTSAASLYRGFLNGAVQSGLRAAVQALLILRPQSVAWQDLAEVQKASVVYRYPTHWELLKSSINLYNAVFYSSIGLLIICLVKKRNFILNLS